MAVLSDIKKLVGIYEEDTNWDLDILVSINTAMATVNQIGLPFTLVDSNTTWNNLTTDVPLQSLLKSYLWMKVKQIFDPSQSNNAKDAMTNLLNELEFRIMVITDGGV